MTKFIFFLLVTCLPLVYSCNQTKPMRDNTAEKTDSLSEKQALEALRLYLQELPEADVYVLDSATINDTGTQWQILVPRTDWAGRMPNKAAFEVDKQTGKISTRPVK